MHFVAKTDETSAAETPVLVAGGGPAGLAAAAELALHGVACVVLAPGRRCETTGRGPMNTQEIGRAHV